ncbi:MAG: lysylphosphatidylglycerol synthase transmembrane domain-containing protein [Candidatus Eremiobacteraeota bacterium]|nr:lysylphosphatidylglycerol synthase transmembrane domain-containing protein [Candidatus Eremiobacteraeota bacterium]
MSWLSISEYTVRVSGQKADIIPMENLKKWRKVLEIAISIGLLWLIISQFKNTEWIKLLVHAKISYVLLALVIFMAGNVMNVYKWQMIAHSLGITVSFRKAFRIYMVGAFINTFLPAGAGEIKRTLDLSKDNKEYVASFISVVLERWTGFMALLLMASVGLAIDYENFRHTQFPSILAIVGGAGILGSCVMFGAFGLVGKLKRFEALKSIVESLERIGPHFRKNLRLVIEALIITLPQPLLIIWYFQLLAQSLSLTVPLQVYYFTVPFILIISQIPISIAGIGVQEACFLAVFRPLDVPLEGIFSLSILSYAGKFASAMIGAAYYFHGTIACHGAKECPPPLAEIDEEPQKEQAALS